MPSILFCVAFCYTVIIAERKGKRMENMEIITHGTVSIEALIEEERHSFYATMLVRIRELNRQDGMREVAQ